MADMIDHLWICPICGPSMVMDGTDIRFCVRHGTQEDIDREAQDNLRVHWAAFCNGEPFYGDCDFPEFMKAAGLIKWVPVEPEDLDYPFAAELGFEIDGMKWILTDAGRAAITKAEGRP